MLLCGVSLLAWRWGHPTEPSPGRLYHIASQLVEVPIDFRPPYADDVGKFGGLRTHKLTRHQLSKDLLILRVQTGLAKCECPGRAGYGRLKRRIDADSYGAGGYGGRSYYHIKPAKILYVKFLSLLDCPRRLKASGTYRGSRRRRRSRHLAHPVRKLGDYMGPLESHQHVYIIRDGQSRIAIRDYPVLYIQFQHIPVELPVAPRSQRIFHRINLWTLVDVADIDLLFIPAPLVVNRISLVSIHDVGTDRNN